MDDLRLGRIFRAVRRRRCMTQAALAEAADVGRWAISDIECGRLDRTRVGTLRRVGKVLEIRVAVEPSWRGGQLERLVDSRHAALVERVVALLQSSGWQTCLEYTFNRYGERGAVDILAWNAESAALLIIEVKTEIDGIGEVLSSLDRKARLVPGIVATDKGWRAMKLGVVLVVAEGSAARSVVARHRASFTAALPSGNARVKRWIVRRDAASLRGIWFLRNAARGSVVEAQDNPRRIRTSKSSVTSASTRSNELDPARSGSSQPLAVATRSRGIAQR